MISSLRSLWLLLGTSQLTVWLAVLLMLLLLFLPIAAYLADGWRQRRNAIISSFNDKAIELYFKQFHPNFAVSEAISPQEGFRRYYSEQFGRHNFIIAFAVFIAVASAALILGGFTAADLLTTRTVAAPHIPALALTALLGAYMFCASDVISRWWSCQLSPSNLWWYSLRFAIAVPMAYALTSAFNPALAYTIAFLLGAFPTGDVQRLARTFAAKQLATDAPENPQSELQKLQGINTINATKFGDEGISTLVELAYADPVKLAIRTNISFSAIVDYMSQALLWMYLTDDLPKVAKIGLRGAYEVRALWLDIVQPQKPEDRDLANELVARAAGRLEMDIAEMNVVWDMVALDPYTIFLCEVW